MWLVSPWSLFIPSPSFELFADIGLRFIDFIAASTTTLTFIDKERYYCKNLGLIILLLLSYPITSLHALLTFLHCF